MQHTAPSNKASRPSANSNTEGNPPKVSSVPSFNKLVNKLIAMGRAERLKLDGGLLERSVHNGGVLLAQKKYARAMALFESGVTLTDDPVLKAEMAAKAIYCQMLYRAQITNIDGIRDEKDRTMRLIDLCQNLKGTYACESGIYYQHLSQALGCILIAQDEKTLHGKYKLRVNSDFPFGLALAGCNWEGKDELKQKLVVHLELALAQKELPDTLALEHLGMLLEEEHYPERIELFERMAKMKPDNDTLWCYIGQLYQRREWHENGMMHFKTYGYNAIDAYERALTLNPENIIAGGNLSYLFGMYRKDNKTRLQLHWCKEVNASFPRKKDCNWYIENRGRSACLK